MRQRKLGVGSAGQTRYGMRIVATVPCGVDGSSVSSAVGAVQLGEPRPHVLQPDPERRISGSRAEPHAVVGHAELQPIAVEARGDEHATRRAARRQPMADRVLHQQLQHERRNTRRAQRVRHVEIHRQPLEAQHLDLQVCIDEPELVLQRRLLTARDGERGAEERGECRDRGVGLRRVGVHEARDRVQRVEQEVRVQLKPERLQPRRRELRLQGRLKDGVVALALHVHHEEPQRGRGHQQEEDRTGY